VAAQRPVGVITRGTTNPNRLRRVEAARPLEREGLRFRRGGFEVPLDELWARQSPHAAYGARQRFLATAAALGGAGWSVLDGPSRWWLGELTVAWADVAPHQGP